MVGRTGIGLYRKETKLTKGYNGQEVVVSYDQPRSQSKWSAEFNFQASKCSLSVILHHEYISSKTSVYGHITVSGGGACEHRVL